MREENSFEDPEFAKEWIQIIDADQGGSRERELYPLLSQWLGELSPEVVVEIGSGTGVISSKIDLSDRQYIGIEPSKTLIERARDLYSTENKKFLSGTAYDTGLPNESVGAVFSLGVWFHLKDLDTAHKEMARILTTNGEIMIITANPGLYHVWESWFVNPEKDGNVLTGGFKVGSRMISKNIFYMHSEEEILKSLNSNGFKILSLEKLGFGSKGEYIGLDEGFWMVIRASKS
jgi:ubiquinone/menaquinone biosynthesis C-methylase UbiE